jgi:GNAT superfamily N-acetyltransferase
MELKNYTAKAHLFFDMMPVEWQETIMPFWEGLMSTTQLYVLVEQDAIVAGGLVFTKCPPDLMYYEKEAKTWFKKGYLYLGFIFVDESQRNRNLGSFWLDHIKDLFQTNGFWLAIEDENLHKFYDKNGFKRVATITNKDSEEEHIYAYKP